MKVYIVSVGEGQYDDYGESHLFGYFSEKEAKEVVDILNKIRKSRFEKYFYECIEMKDRPR